MTDASVSKPNGTSTAHKPVPDPMSFPKTGTPLHEKPSGYEFYRKIGSPRHIVAPMVDHSELAWRILSRRYGSDLVYTPMINAKVYVQKNRGTRRVQEAYFNKQHGEEGAHLLQLDGSNDTDRPLIVQFCANDPDALLEAACTIQDRCDAVDLNLGCPQQIAKRGNFGAFLQDDWPLVFSLINRLHIHLKVPVTAKFRVYETVEQTLAYARMIERAGAQMVTVHGRTREMKGHKTGLADWAKIRAVKQALSIPVFANGNILYPQDWRDALAFTGVDGVMSAEGNLYNPTLFYSGFSHDLSTLSQMEHDNSAFAALHICKIADEYLDIVKNLKTPTPPSSVKGHMFKITRPALAVHQDLRPMLGQARLYGEKEGEERIKEYREFVRELARRLEEDRKDPRWYKPDPDVPRYYMTPEHLQDPSDRTTRPEFIPHWYLQPYFRPPLNPPKQNGNAQSGSAPQAAGLTGATEREAPESQPGETHKHPAPDSGVPADLGPEPKRVKIQ